MRLALASDQVKKLRVALQHAGKRETGGQLYGEQLAPSDFRVTELTVQARPGTFARFIVDVVEAAREGFAFFTRHRNEYTRFNYIGEWHSHPSFAVSPSPTDRSTMHDLVRDADFRGSFAILMIVRLQADELLSGAWLYDPAGAEATVHLEVENGEN